MSTEPILELPFSTGIDESRRAETLDPRAAFVNLENVRQHVNGGAGKRYGFTAQTLARSDTSFSNRSAGARMFADGERTCVIDGTYLDTYTSVLPANVPHGRVPECGLSTRLTVTASAGVAGVTSHLVDMAYVGGYIAYAFAQVGQVYCAVEDTAGNIILPPKGVAAVAGGAGAVVALASYSTYFILLVGSDAGANIAAYYLNTSNSTTLTTGWVSIGNVATDNLNPSAILSTQSLTNRIAFAYINASGGASQVTVKTVTIAGVVETATVNTGGVTPARVAVEGSIADTLWVCWNETTAVRLIGLDADALAVTLATTATIITLDVSGTGNIGIVSSATAGRGKLVVLDGAVDRMQLRSFQTSVGAAAADGNQAEVPAAMLSSRPFRVGTRYYALFQPYPGTSTGHVILCDFTDVCSTGDDGVAVSWLRPVAKVAPPGLGIVPNEGRCHVESIGSSRYITPVSITRSGVARATALVTLDFADANRWLPVIHGGMPILSGGLVSGFDGRRVAELGFVVHPPQPTGTVAGSGITGTYRYVLAYEEVDAKGNWAISDVSDPSAEITPADDTVTLTVRPCSITARQRRATGNDVRIVIYRTLDGGEAPYYRLAALSNLTNAVTQTYADSTADAALAVNAKLYTQPGDINAALPREAPPALSRLVAYNGMLVGSYGEDLWYTAYPISGEEPWFASEFQIPVPGGGEITALAAQDGALFVFKRHCIFAVSGEPPSPNNNVGGLGTPRRLAVDVGASQRPTCVTSMGVWFVSDRGIELLTRGQTVEWIGDKVQETFASFPTVHAITFDPDSSCVLVECEGTGESLGTGRTLVYDTRTKVWQSIDRRKNAAGTSNTPAQDACVVWSSSASAWRYAWLGGDDGRVYVEDQSTHLDPGSAWVTARAETSWVHLAGVQGEQNIDRVLLLGEWHTGHEFVVSAYRDYLNSSAETKQWTAAQLAALTKQWTDREIIQARSQGLRVVLSDDSPSSGSVGTGKGATWVCLTFNGEPLRGAKRTSSAQRGG